VEGVVDASAVIPGELANTGYHIINIRLAHLPGVKNQLPVGKTGFGETP